MRLPLLLPLLLLGLAGEGACAEPAIPVSAVVLHPGSATVVREAPVGPGTTQLVFSGLPARFDARTLRAEGGPGVRIGLVSTLEAAGAQSLNPAEADLEARILALQDQQAALDAEIESAALVKRYLERFAAEGGPSPDKASPAPDAKALSGLLDVLGRGAGESAAKILRLNLHKRELGKRAELLQRELARLRSGIRDTRRVTVAVTAERPGTVRLSYQVPDAGWKPGYRAGLDSAASRLEIERLATVAQKTGEDWNQVQLTLSTAQPRQSVSAPEPRPWVLSYRPPVPPQAGRPPAAASVAMAGAPAARLAEAADNEAPYEPPTFETHGTFATDFMVPTPVTLPADGRDISVSLAKVVLPARHHLRVAPRLEPSAVVVAEADRPAGVWLPGPAQLFRDGSYVGSAPWNPAAADRFVFSFGRDELLRVSVDPLEDKSGTTGLFDKRIEQRRADVFSLTNAHPTPVKVVVLEASPVSASEEVSVRAAFDPPPTIQGWEQRRGIVAWEKTLPARETAKFTVDYRIEHPKEGSVAGLR